jgi:hypothetical protein
MGGSFGNGDPNGFVDMSDPAITENKNPYVINSTYVKEDKQTVSPVVKIVILAAIALVLIIAFVVVRNKYFSSHDLTPDVNLSEDELAKKYKMNFEEDKNMLQKVPRWTDAKVSVKSDKDLCVVYANGKQVGLHTSNKRYTIYGVKVGDPDYKVEDMLTFKHESNFSVLNDIGNGSATAYYYYDWSKNACVVLTVNDTSNRIVAITYYSDLKTMTNQLEFD